MKIGTALFMALDEYGSWRKQPTISALIPYSEAITFIDEDLEFVVRRGLEMPVKEYGDVKISLQLLLKVVPICALARKKEAIPINMKPEDIAKLRDKLKVTVSPSL
jgi:hypothetical protein